MITEVWEDEAVWPSFSEVASILSLSKATISKQARNGRIAFSILGFGRGRHVVAPREVLRLGHVYRRAPLSVVQERLAAHLASRATVDVGALRDELRAVADSITDADTERPSNDEPAPVPPWLYNVDHLVAHPEALAGTLAFVSPDELGGMARLGGRIDDDAPFSQVEGTKIPITLSPQ